MNDRKTKIGQPVIAMLQEDGQLKGVELKMKHGAFELLWTKTGETKETDWPSFAAACGVSTGSADAKAQNGRTLVVGYSSAGTVFHRASMPSVETKELASIVQFQAETRMPLPAEQIELAWRVDPTHNGQMDVTMAVARKALLQRFAENVRCLDPSKIRLDCEAVVKAWTAVFSEHQEEAIVVSMGRAHTHVCLVKHARLSNAVILDSGLADFVGSPTAPADNDVPSSDTVLLDSGLEGFSVDSEVQAEVAERFAQDIRSVVEFFGYTDSATGPIFLMSDSSEVYTRIAASLNAAHCPTRVAIPDGQRIGLTGDFDLQRLHEYRVPIGLGLMALDGCADELDLFKNVYQPADQQVKKRRRCSVKVATAIAAVMLLGLLVVSYVIDLKTPQAIRTRIEASMAGMNTNLDALVERQRLIKAVARERPDVLALLTLINTSGEDGVMLNSLDFKKGQKVTITGQVKDNDQLYQFQEKLRAHKDLAEVKILSTGKVSRSGGGNRPSGGPPGRGGGKGKGITFTMTFQYKNFGKKTRTGS